MAITRQTLLTRARQWADAVSASSDWPDPLVLDTANFVFVDEWKKLLGAAPFYQTMRGTATTDTTGRFALTTLNSGSGDSAKTAHRVLQLRGDHGDYQFVDASRVDLLQDLTGFQRDRIWTRVGTEIQVVGNGASATFNVLANWLPTTPMNLATDASTVSWPEGYETLLYMETAALMLAKAGRETNEAVDLQRQAEAVRQKMLGELARESGSPRILAADDSPDDWGG